MIKICERCGKEFETKTTAKRCPECKNIRICSYCGKEYAAKSKSKTCSPECSKKSIMKTKLEKYGSATYNNREKSRKTNLEKYGVENVSQLQEIKDKKVETSLKNYGTTHYAKTKEREKRVKQTNLEKFGTEYASQNDKIKNKIRDTMIKRYGSYYTNREKQRKTMMDNYDKYYVNPEKAKKTNLERYGVENVAQNEKTKEKIMNTNLERYNVKSPLQNKEILNKMIKNNIEKYGVSSTLMLDEAKEKARKTNLEKYGNEVPIRSEIIKNKIRKTNMKKYGVDNPTKNREVIEKVMKTNLEKYGVPYYCMTKKCRDGTTAISNVNLYFEKLLNKNNILHKLEFPLDNRSYDFHILNTNILVEINPSPYHNSTWHPYNKIKAKDYHYNKTITAKENNYQCIHIWDWDDLNKVINILKPKTTLYSRKLKVREVSKEDTKDFLNMYHLQSSCNGQIVRLGLYQNSQLVEIMTFGKPRYNKNYEWELLRLCTKSKYKVVGGAEKLFKYFIKNYNPSSIISYCDNSKFTGNVYERLGFKLLDYGKPRRHWYNIETDKHITDNLLKQRGFDQLLGKEYGTYGKGTSNEQLMREHGFLEIYDCGQSTWIYQRIN